MAKIENAKKPFVTIVLSLLLLSQPGVLSLWQEMPAIAQEESSSESSTASDPQVPSVPSAPITMASALASATAGGGDFTWQLLCGEPGTNRNIACDEACQPCFSDTYYFWRKFLLVEFGYFYTNAQGSRIKVPVSTGQNICRDGVSPTSGQATVLQGVTPLGMYTTWKINEYMPAYTLYSDTHAAIVCPRGGDRTDYYWDDQGNPGTSNDGRFIIHYTPAPSPQCSDGIDNDGDGATDYPADFSCTSPTDNDETNPKAQCQDGIDNDGDGLTDFPADPGCSSKQDNDEHNICPAATQTSTCRCATNSDCTAPDTCQSGICRPVTYQCNDGIDNDGDGATDYPADFSCTSPTDNDETNPKAQCQDGIDNDGNGYTDYPSDTGCSSAQDNTESGGQSRSQCSDGVDNDGDGKVDLADAGCTDGNDNSETNPPVPSLTCGGQAATIAFSEPNVTVGYGPDPYFPGQPKGTPLGTQYQSAGIVSTIVGGVTYFSRNTITNGPPGPSGNPLLAIDTIPPVTGPPAVHTIRFVNPQNGQQATVPGGSIRFFIADTESSVTVRTFDAAGQQIEQRVLSTLSTTMQFSIGQVARIDFIDTGGDGYVIDDFSYGPLNCGFQCSDGIDNDGDGATDFPNDFSCTTATDNDETNPKAQCQDGIDNDGDGRIDYPADPGCSSSQDNSEAGEAQCQDGIDNDGDGATDYPADFSCTSPTDNDETNPKAQCQDGIDNDGDGLTDFPADPGCSSKQDNDEHNICPAATQTSTCRCATNSDCTAPDTCQSGICRPQESADLSIQKSGPATIQRGSVISYTVTVTNHGPSTANGVTIGDTIPAGVTFNAGASHASCYVYPTQTDLVVCSTPSLAANQSISFTVAFNVPTTVACNTVLQNVVATSSGTPDPNTSNNHSSIVQGPVQTTVTCPAQCSDGIDNDQDGATDYPADFSCSGPTDNDETNPRAACQDGIDNDGDGLIDYPNDPGCSSNQDNDEHNICPAATQTSTCRCATNSDCTAPDTCQSGICRPQGADLSVTKTGPSTVVAGNSVSYTVTASNAGPATATNVVIADVIPSGLTFNAGQSTAGCVLNGNGTSVLCNNFSLTNGQSRTFTIVFNIPSTQACGGNNVIQNQATVSSSSQDPNTSNNTSQTVTTGVTCPTPQADLSVQKTGPASVLRGDTITYTVTAQNAGPNTAMNVVISDVIPAGLTFNAAGSSPSCILNGAGTSVLCNNFNLNAGENRSFTLAFTASTSLSCGATISNTADVSSSSPDPVSSNNHSNQVSTSVTCPTADVTIVKSGPQSVNRGGNLLYTVTVTNLGPQRSDNVVVVDRPESMAGLTYNGSLSDPDCVLNGVEILCNNISLQAGQSRTYNIVFAVSSTFTCGGTVANRANANVSTPDPHGDNNWSDRIVTTVNCTQCNDGIDNDQDGATDYPNDFSCSDANDNDETLPRAQCQDGIDNDGDGLIDFPNDPGCSSNQDNDESNIVLNPDAAIQKSGPTTVIRGNTVSYMLTVTNIGAATAQNVVVADMIPAGLTFQAGASSPECILNGAGTSVLCNNFSLAVGQTRTFTVTFTVTSSVACGANIQNTATVSTSNDTNPANNASQWNTAVQCIQPQCSDGIDNDGDGATDYPADFSCSDANDNDETLPRAQCQDGIDNDGDGLIDFPNDPGCSSNQDNDESNLSIPDLAITKTGPQTVNRGDTVSYTVTVTNVGTATALNAVVADVIPSGLTFHGGLSSTDCLLNGAGTSVLCNNFSLAAGQTRTFTITFNVPTTVTCGSTIQNTATVSTSNDQNGSNNTSQTVSTTVQCPTPQADLSIQKSVSPSSVVPGQPLTYTLFVQNLGPGTAQNVIVSDSLPAGLPFAVQFLQSDGFSCWRQGSDPNHLVCTLSSMAPGATATIRFTATVTGSSCTPQTLLNTAAVTAVNSSDPNGNNNYAQASAQLNCQNPVFTITKTDNRTTAQPGDILTYQVAVTNTSDVNGTNVTVTDLLPGSVTFLSASDAGMVAGGSVTWQNLSIPAHTTKTLTVTVQVQFGTPNGTVLTNYASVAGATAQDQTTVQTVTTADLSINKTGPQLAQRGSTIFYTLTVFNAGPGSSQNATVTDVVPGGLTFLPQQSSPQCSLSSGTVTCSGISLAAGQSQSLTLAFEIPPSVVCGTILLNAAEVHGINDPNCVNDLSQTVTTAVQCINPTFTISKTDGHTTAQPGDTLTYSVSVTNTSAVNATNVTVTDTLPSLVTFLNASDGGTQTAGVVTWSGLSIAAGATKNLTVQVQVSQSAANGAIITNYANVAGVSAQDSTTVQIPQTNADVSVTKTGPQTAQQGSIALYTVTAFNAGPATATNVVVGDVIPAGFTFNQAQTSSGCVLNGAGTSVLCNNFSLTNGQSRSFTIAFNVTQTATCNAAVQNTATVSTSSSDTNPANNVSQPVSTTVQCPTPTFTISKTDGHTTAQPGDALTYSVSVTNTSTVNATSVTVTDVLPGQTTFVSASDGGTLSSGIVTWSNLSIAAGATKNLTVQVQVSAQAANGTVLTNYARVSGIEAQDTTTVQTATTGADLSITKTGPSIVQQGSVVLYTVSVSNAGPSTATNVVVADVIPSGFTFNQAQSSSGCVLNGNGTSVLCNNFSLTSSQSRSFTVAFTISSAAACGSAIQNTATVSSSNDPNGSNNTSQTVSTTVQCAEPTFVISKTDGRTTVLPGESLTYQITVTNTSSFTATNVQVTDALPSGVTYVTSSDGGTLNGATVRWTLSSLAAGASKTLIVIVTVPSTASNGTVLTNIAIVGAATAQDATTVNTSSSSSSSSSTSSSSSSACNLTVTLRDSQDPVNSGDTFTYTVEVRNNNGSTVNNVSLTQTLDSNVDFLSTTGGGNDDAGNTIRWTGLSIGGNATSTFQTTVRVRNDRDGVTIRSNAFACSAQDSENTRVNGNDIPPPPPPPPPGGTLTIDKQADRTEAQAGSIIAYTISVRNQSNVAVGPVTIEDTFSASDMTVEYADGGSVSGGSISWDLGTLGANATHLIHYRVRLNPSLQHGQTVSNTVQVLGGNATDTAQVQIIRYFPQTGLLTRFTQLGTDKAVFLQPVSPKKRDVAADGSIPGLTWIILLSMGMTGGGLLGKKFLLGF